MQYAVRRPAYSRAALMLVALLSALLLGGVQGASCAMHGLGATQDHVMADGDMAGHAGMAGMSHEGGTTDSSSHDSCCTCIGDCTMVAPLASAPGAPTLLVALFAPEPGRTLDVEPRRPLSVEPDRLLPFANGPPASALI